jgi:hypothetical protein
MSRPPYNREPTGPWRDSGDRDPLLPEIDPNWRRRRVQREEPGTIWLPVVLGLCVLGLAWHLRSPTATERLPPESVIPPAQAAEAAPPQPMSEEAQRAIQEQADWSRRQAENASSINGKIVRRCRYQSSESLQTEPCRYPWVEVVSGDDGSRWQRVQDQEQMRLAAEARLAEEQRRFQAAVGGSSDQTVYESTVAASGPNSTRCIDAKARRDEAYRVVGNRRSFEFIRRWQDIVYDACKS